MAKKGSGTHTREEWKRPTQAMRKAKTRQFTLSPEAHEALDALPDRERSATVDAVLRAHFGLPPLARGPA